MRFLQAHPDACLVDVREDYEFAATATARRPAGGAERAVEPPDRACGDWLRSR
jgi:rhodanese-related sulfurtransferase